MTNHIGASPLRPDGFKKVTGAARYPADLVRPDMLHCAVVFAHRPHARIIEVDTSAARALSGVQAVLTAEDVPYNAFGLIEHDQPVLCGDIVRFEGDKVALVVAESRRTALAGAKLVRVQYEDLPAVTDPLTAMQPDAPCVHANRDNVLIHVPIRKGDTARAFAEAAVVVEGEYTTTWQEHAFLQPEAGVAYVDEQERLVIETAGQWLHEDRRQIALMLQIPDDRVIVRYAAIGGAFGGREDMSIQHVLALAAWKLRRPVALVWGREESMIGHHKRHPFSVRCRWGATSDGVITAIEAKLVADGGAYASTSAEVIKIASVFANGSYQVANIAVDGYAVYTNNIPAGAFRGFGAPQIQFAVEIMVGRLAEALGIEPIEIRRRNLYQEGGIESTGNVLPHGVSASAVLEACVSEMNKQRNENQESGTRNQELGTENQEPGTRNREPGTENQEPGTRNRELGTENQESGTRNREPGTENQEPRTRNREPGTENQEPRTEKTNGSHIRRGWGVASGIKNVGYSFGFPEQSTATVELHGGALIEQAIVRVGAADVGQGAHSALRQIAAEALALPLECVTMITDDSSEAPNAGSASASRMTLMGGRAVHDASITALGQWHQEERPAVATVQFRPPRTTPLDPITGAGTPNYCYGYVAQAVEVEVNTLTGQVQVLTIMSAHDVGKAINPQQVEGQIEGCLAQALGYALIEDFQMHNGKVLTPSFSTYLLPTTLDMPTKIVPIILELADPNGPYGARGMSEMALVPLAPAVAAAIHDATGVWLNQQPMTPERVLTALQSNR